MKDIIGFSFIIGTNVSHFGKYIPGIWFDNCDINKLPKLERKGFGFKFDICFGNIIRPMGYFWKKDFWFNKKCIKDIPKDKWKTVFGKELALKINHLNPDWHKYRIYNPWYALHSFVLRLPKFIPSFFISVGIGTIISIYFGNKEYSINPMGRDYTWVNSKDKKRAMKEKPITEYSALCPSITIRKTRMT